MAFIIGPNSDAFEPYLRDKESIHGPEESDGWAFGAGDPEFWRFSDILLKPDGRLLDIGISDGRGSMFFALHGMQVVGVDNSEVQLAAVRKIKSELADFLELPIDLICSDVFEEPLPEGEFDTVLLNYMLHAPSRIESLKLIEKTYASLKPGGHVLIRACGKADSGYQDMFINPYTAVEALDEDTVAMWCDCSGETKLEPMVFLDPLDVHVKLAQLGGRIVHSQTIPTKGAVNILFGEDYRQGMEYETGGMITVIAQKPFEKE